MKIGVIGLGVVGSAVRHGLERINHEVIGYDIKDGSIPFEEILGTELCFICVPTNPLPDGGCDTSIVEGVLEKLSGAGYAGLTTIKSTVIPGTTDRLSKTFPGLRLSFCPEFLRERAAFIDFYENHDICAIGAYTPEDAEHIRKAHGSIPKSFAHMTPLEAELVKYFSNIFNALRITFANEFYEVCKVLGADYAAVKGAAVQRENIPDYYLDSNERFRGFAGVCLPKDTQAFANLVETLGLTHLNLFKTIVEDNKRFTQTVPEGMRER